jgi:hypothetical protein
MPCLTATVIVAFALGGFGPDNQQVFSGPQPGEKLTPFKVFAVTGASSGKQTELLAEPKDTPRLLVFVHELTRPAMQFLRPIDQYSTKLAAAGLETNYVWLTADKAKTEQYLKGLDKTLGLGAPVVISLDGVEGPGNYGLNRKVALTIVVAKGDKVAANFAIIQPNETDAPPVAAAMAKLLGKKPPSDDDLGIQRKVNPRDQQKQAGSPELQGLMRKMIQKTNDETAVQEIAAQMRKWAGDDAGRQKELRDYCRMILDLDYGTEACKKALKQLAGK